LDEETHFNKRLISSEMIYIKKQSTDLNLQKDTELFDPIYLDIMLFYEFPNSVSQVDDMMDRQRDTFQYSLPFSSLSPNTSNRNELLELSSVTISKKICYFLFFFFHFCNSIH